MSLLRQKLFRWKEKPKILKTEWPELVGKIQIIPENSFVVKDLEDKRVRIFVDREQTVIKTPCIG